MYFSKDADSVPTFESPWIHRGWTPASNHCHSLRSICLFHCHIGKLSEDVGGIITFASHSH